MHGWFVFFLEICLTSSLDERIVCIPMMPSSNNEQGKTHQLSYLYACCLIVTLHLWWRTSSLKYPLLIVPEESWKISKTLSFWKHCWISLWIYEYTYLAYLSNEIFFSLDCVFYLWYILVQKEIKAYLMYQGGWEVEISVLKFQCSVY